VTRRWSAALPDSTQVTGWPESQHYPNGSSYRVFQQTV